MTKLGEITVLMSKAISLSLVKIGLKTKKFHHYAKFCRDPFLKGLPETSVMAIWNMEIAILSHNQTLVVSVDIRDHLPTFEGVRGYVDPIWGKK